MFISRYQFKYTWRKYQANVLSELESHMGDNKLNIVAAPGSGKTILGLEIVRRLDRNVLILSPTLTIKNQWLDRFLTLFVQDEPPPDFISSDIYNLNRFNVATYQGLHFAHQRKKIDEHSEAGAEEEDETATTVRGTNIDYDLIAELKARNINVVVLDEAHHLRSAWWKSLTEVINALDGVKTIALTATPPYDVEKNEWEKYVDLCGPVDCEISVPELVATGDLCPHQDFVIFNRLTLNEEKKALDIQGAFDAFCEKLRGNQDFIQAIAALPELNNYQKYEEKIFDNPKYYSSLLIFMHAAGAHTERKLAKALGGGAAIPPLDLGWLECMLQGILFDDADSFSAHRAVIDEIRAELTRIGGIEKKKVMLVGNNEIKKLLAGSVAKMDSISEIARREYACLGGNLSMAILVDYIRAEAMSLDDYNKIGVVPIFKRLINANLGAKIAILTGSLKVIPHCLIPFVKARVAECTFQDSGLDGYVKINIRDAYKNRLVATITEAVVEKELNIVIGTVALLGEGWDCPAINSLILASFVGSFMLSNQMRGRAIRTNPCEPEKVANIWHLVGITRRHDKKLISASLDLSDYDTLKRRFQGFVGIAYTDNVILNGLERLDIINEKNLPKEHKNVNHRMYALAKDRAETKRRWYEILALFGGESIKLTNTLQWQDKKEERFKTLAMADFLKLFWSILIQTACLFLVQAFGSNYIFTYAIIINIWNLIFLSKVVGHFNPVSNMSKVGNTVLDALHKLGQFKTPRGQIKNHCERIKDDGDRVKFEVYSTRLLGATVYENNLYIKCMQEIYSRVANPRYVIVVKTILRTSYFSVPALFAVNKASAEIFMVAWKKRLGKGKLAYTRSADGRKTLLASRKGSFNYDERFFERTQAVRGKNWR
ncbi:MAG: DEAD/DEAH box helicase family protein [Oscillospiraceae bacterium]|nr:DEAD/DEAH box helicase family protein [Oscillospiraceae bacterium]